MADKIKVRARMLLFHGGTRVRAGEVFEVTPAHLAYTKARFKDRKIDPPFELVAPPKAAPKDDNADVSDLA